MLRNTFTPSEMKDRVVRVFLSSTFRDMQEERNVLVRKTFAELRYRCRKRRVRFVEVDLRWGITEEQAHQGMVVPLCLEAIDECSKGFFIFIGFLGELYGWTPDSADPEVEKRFPIVSKYKGRSVTELEMAYGALDNPDKANSVHFYLRDPKYIVGIPIKDRNNYVTRDKIEQDNLAALKDRIRSSGLRFRDNYADPEALGDMIIEDIWADIDKRFPADEAPEHDDREDEEHEAYMIKRCEIYVEREDYFQRLDQHVSGDEPTPPLVLLGESGIGKSALLANWAKRYGENHPDEHIFLHFIGSTPGSADHIGLVRRLILDIKKRFGIQKDLPNEPEKLLEDLAMWLAEASFKGRMVIVIDALNQLEDTEEGQRLRWLPTYFPPNVRVILSTLPGPSLEALQHREKQELTLEGMSYKEREQVIAQTLGAYRKALSPDQVEKIVKAPQTAIPLYLTALLDELRIFGVFEELQTKMTKYLEALTIPDLYQMILARWEADYNIIRKELVQDTLCLLWASRYGMSRQELQAIMGHQDNLFEEDKFYPAYIGMHESLVERSEMISFAHQYIRKAVESKYLATTAKRQEYHRALANYFEEQVVDHRVAQELPWQLKEAEDWEKLISCLSGPDVFHQLSQQYEQHELHAYWMRLDIRGFREDFEKALDSSLERLEELKTAKACQISIQMVSFLVSRFAMVTARLHVDGVVKRCKELFGSRHPVTADALSLMTDFHLALGNVSELSKLCEEVYVIRNLELGPYHPLTLEAANNLAVYTSAENKPEKVLESLKTALDGYDKSAINFEADRATTMANLGFFKVVQGKYDEGVSDIQEGLDLALKLLGPSHSKIGTLTSMLGGAAKTIRDFDKAKDYYYKARLILKSSLGANHPRVADVDVDLGDIANELGNKSEAEAYYTGTLETYDRHLGAWHLKSMDVCKKLADLGALKGDVAPVERYLRRKLAYGRIIHDYEDPEPVFTMLELSQLLLDAGRIEECKRILWNVLEILEQEFNWDKKSKYLVCCMASKLLNELSWIPEAEKYADIALDIANIFETTVFECNIEYLEYYGRLLTIKEDYLTAEKIFRKALQLRQRDVNQTIMLIARTQKDLASALSKLEKHDEATEIFSGAAQSLSDEYGPKHQEVILGFVLVAESRAKKGDLSEAESILLENLDTSERVMGLNHKTTIRILVLLAQISIVKHQVVDADEYLETALRRSENKLQADPAQVCYILLMLARVRRNWTGTTDEAVSLISKALNISRKHFGPANPTSTGCLNQLHTTLVFDGRLEEAVEITREMLDAIERSPSSPELYANLVCNAADLFRDIGNLKEATTLYQKAYSIRKVNLGENHPQTLYTLRCMHWPRLTSMFFKIRIFIHNKHTQRMRRMGRATKGMRSGSIDPALYIEKLIFGVNHPRIAYRLGNRAIELCERKDFAEAERILIETVGILEKKEGKSSYSTNYYRSWLASALSEQGKYYAAAQHQAIVFEMEKKESGLVDLKTIGKLSYLIACLAATGDKETIESLANSNLEEARRDLGDSHSSVRELKLVTGNSYHFIRDYVKAVALFRDVLEQYEREYGAISLEAATVHFYLGESLKAQYNYEEAELHLKKALTIRKRLLGSGHTGTGSAVLGLAQIYAHREAPESEGLYRHYLSLVDHAQEKPNLFSIQGRLRFAQYLYTTCRNSEAEELLYDIFRDAQRYFGNKHYVLIEITIDVALNHISLGKTSLALEYLDEGVKICSSLTHIDNSKLGKMLSIRSLAEFDLGRLDRAHELRVESVAIFNKEFGEKHPQSLRALAGLALLESKLGDLDSALAHARKAFENSRGNLGKVDKLEIFCATRLGEILHSMDNHDEAEMIIRRALTIQEQSYGERSYDTRTLMIRLSDCLCYLGNLREAESLLTRAHEIESAILPNDDFRFCYSANVLAKLLFREGEHDGAIHNARWACALISKAERPLQLAEMQVDLCRIIHYSGRHFDPELLRNAVAVLENASPHMGIKGRALMESLL